MADSGQNVTVSIWRAVCTCDEQPFYEGFSETAARRHYASLKRQDNNPAHVGRLERADVMWVMLERTDSGRGGSDG